MGRLERPDPVTQEDTPCREPMSLRPFAAVGIISAAKSRNNLNRGGCSQAAGILDECQAGAAGGVIYQYDDDSAENSVLVKLELGSIGLWPVRRSKTRISYRRDADAPQT